MPLKEFLVIGLALIVLGISGWIVLGEINAEQVAYKEFIAEAESGLPAESGQFYPNLRFEDRRIAYSIGEECNSDKEKDIISALDLLESRTILEFYPGERGIDYLCDSLPSSVENERHFVAGEGGPVGIINASQFYLIKDGQVSLFRPEKCDVPNVALHETLHALGFDHNNNSRSIMYPITSCDQEIDDYIIEEINRLYGIESLPDLSIERVSANKTGRYMNFDMAIGNVGILASKNSSLKISSEGEVLGEYFLNEIDIGVTRTLSVRNLRISKSSESILFHIQSLDPDREMKLDNNRADISINEN